MPSPTKPFIVLKSEKKSHRTKAELKQREQGEKALASGVALKERPEVKTNPVAHAEFLRLSKLLKTIEKNDAIYESVINRYCLIQSECSVFEKRREQIFNSLDDLEDARSNMDEAEYFRLVTSLNSQALSMDKQLQTKRRMLFDIERENIMTIAAALRCIPKKVDTEKDPLLEVLKGSK